MSLRFISRIFPDLLLKTNDFMGACRRPEHKFCRRQNLDQSGLAARIPARGIQALSTVTPDDDRQREQTNISKINGPSGLSAAPGGKIKKDKTSSQRGAAPFRGMRLSPPETVKTFQQPRAESMCAEGNRRKRPGPGQLHCWGFSAGRSDGHLICLARRRGTHLDISFSCWS